MNGTPSLFLAFSLLVACGGEPPVPAPASDPGTTPTTAPVPPSAPPLGVEVTPSTEPSDPLRQRIVLESMGGCALGGDGGVWCWNAGFAPRQVPGVGPFVDLASSLLTRCGRSATGQIQCWRASTGTPMPAPSGAGYTDVAVTWDEACAVREGHVVCTSAAGTNENAGGLTDAVEVVASVSSVCARRSDGSVSCFEHGSPATPVAGLSGITRLAGDESLACALGSDGGVSCWGAEARFFVEGTPPTTSFLTVAGITGATDLVAGGEGVCGRVADAWLCAGSDVAGRFGQGTTGVRRTAVTATPFGGDALALSGDAACSLRGSEVRCLGNGSGGALGPMTGSMAVTEVLRPAANEAERASDLWLFADAACARIGDHLRCWGNAELDDPTIGLIERARHRRIGPTPLGLHGRLPEIARAYEPVFTRCSLSTTGDLRCHDEPDLRRTGIASVAGGDAGICFMRTDAAIECPRMDAGISLFDNTAAGGEPTGATSVAVGSTFACAAFEEEAVRCAVSREADELAWFGAPPGDEEGDEAYPSGDEWEEEAVSLPAPEWQATEAHAIELVAGAGMVCGRTREGTAWCSGGAVDPESPRTLRRFVDGGAVSLVGGDEFACALIHLEGQPDAVRCFSYQPEILGAEPATDDGWDATSVSGLLAGLAAAPPAPVVPSTPTVVDPSAAPAPTTASTTAPTTAAEGTVVAAAPPHWGIVQIGAGRQHACALRSDGAVFCWGVDSAGQVGRTPSTLHLTPMSMPLGT